MCPHSTSVNNVTGKGISFPNRRILGSSVTNYSSLPSSSDRNCGKLAKKPNKLVTRQAKKVRKKPTKPISGMSFRKPIASEPNRQKTTKSVKVSKPELGPLSQSAYYEYIQSSAWKLVRDRYRTSKQPQECLVCKSPWRPGFHLHHLTYKRLGCERLTDLRFVCVEHHKLIHEVFDDMKKKAEVHRARINKELKEGRITSEQANKLRKEIRNANISLWQVSFLVAHKHQKKH